MAGNSKLTLVGIDRDRLVRVATEGNLTGADTRTTDVNLFQSLLGVNWAASRVLLDMSRTGSIDSAAIGWLIDSHKALKARGGTLVIHSVVPRVRQMLELLNLDQLLLLQADEADARAFLRDRAAGPAPGPDDKPPETETGQ